MRLRMLYGDWLPIYKRSPLVSGTRRSPPYPLDFLLGSQLQNNFLMPHYAIKLIDRYEKRIIEDKNSFLPFYRFTIGLCLKQVWDK
jgi:hypothetical protein